MHDCCLLLWIGPFKCAAVQSDQSLDFRNLHFSRQTVQIVLNLKTEETLAQSPSCKSYHVIVEFKKGSNVRQTGCTWGLHIYNQGGWINASKGYLPLVQQLFPHTLHPRFLSLNQGGLAAAVCCWVHSLHTTGGCDVIHAQVMGIGHSRTSERLPARIVNTLQHTLVPQS